MNVVLFQSNTGLEAASFFLYLFFIATTISQEQFLLRFLLQVLQKSILWYIFLVNVSCINLPRRLAKYTELLNLADFFFNSKILNSRQEVWIVNFAVMNDIHPVDKRK